jgi:hypothetical protein
LSLSLFISADEALFARQKFQTFLRLVLLPNKEIGLLPTAHRVSVRFEVPTAVVKKVLSSGI